MGRSYSTKYGESQASGEAIGDYQPRVSAREFAHALPITPVEAFDIEAKKRQFRFARLPLRGTRLRQRRQFAAAAVQGRFDAAGRRFHEVGDVFERIFEDVFEENARPLFRRKRYHQPLDRALDSPTHGLRRVNQRRARRLSLSLSSRVSPAQEIDTAIVRDP